MYAYVALAAVIGRRRFTHREGTDGGSTPGANRRRIGRYVAGEGRGSRGKPSISAPTMPESRGSTSTTE